LLLELFHLLILEGFFVLRSRPQGILRAEQKLLAPALHPGDGQSVDSIGSADSEAMSPSLVHVGPCRRGGLNFKRSRISVALSRNVFGAPPCAKKSSTGSICARSISVDASLRFELDCAGVAALAVNSKARRDMSASLST
jgi:hypothetical protein